MEEKFKRDIQRTQKSTRTKRAKKDEQKQKVVETFYKLDPLKREMMKPHTRARIIQERLRMKDLLSTDTIKRYLTEENMI